jgi:hypothetical protein
MQKDILGPTFIFDGAMLFLLKKLPANIFETESIDKAYKIKIILTNELQPGNISLQLCNLMFRKVIFFSHNFFL